MKDLVINHWVPLTVRLKVNFIHLPQRVTFSIAPRLDLDLHLRHFGPDVMQGTLKAELRGLPQGAFPALACDISVQLGLQLTFEGTQLLNKDLEIELVQMQSRRCGPLGVWQSHQEGEDFAREVFQ